MNKLILFLQIALQNFADILLVFLSGMLVTGFDRWIFPISNLWFIAIYIGIKTAVVYYLTTPETATSGEGQNTTQP